MGAKILGATRPPRARGCLRLSPLGKRSSTALHGQRHNATLALAMLPRLADLQLVPKQQPQADRAVLEVYPALAKVGGKAWAVRADRRNA